MLRNKPTRRSRTTPMGFSTYGGDDLLSVTAAGEQPGSVCRDGCSRISLETVTKTFEKWEPPLGAVSVVQTARAGFSQFSLRGYSEVAPELFYT